MIVNTLHFGEIEVPDGQLIEFPHGMPGFEQHRRFALIESPSNPFAYLQNVDDPYVGFLVTDPFTFFPNYEFDLDEEWREQLRITDPGDVMVRVTVKLGDGLSQATANLLGPIVINMRERLGQQVVLYPSAYTTREPLLQGTHESGGLAASGEEERHARTQP